jgi:putative phage-type endonuclease
MSPDERMHWLNARRFTPTGGYRVTASDAAAILGWHPTRTAWDVYTNKLTGEEIQDNDAMLMGRLFEEPIAELYAIKTGRRVENPGATSILIHPDHDWLGATLDRHTWELGAEDIPGSPLEIKHAGAQKIKEWDDGAPLWVQIQLQIQIACSDANWGAYCGVVGGRPPIYDDIDRNNRFLDEAIPKLERFIRRCNERDDPPITSPRDLSNVKFLYPYDNGDTVDLDDTYLGIAEQWEEWKSEVKIAEDEKKTREAKLRAAIGEATFGKFPDGSCLALRTFVRKDGVSYRTLKWVS